MLSHRHTRELPFFALAVMKMRVLLLATAGLVLGVAPSRAPGAAGRRLLGEGVDPLGGDGAPVGLPDANWPWVEVDIAPGRAAGEVEVDLAKLNGSTPVALRYAWSNEQSSCCLRDTGLDASAYPCPAAACPLKSKQAQLPANPFMAVLGSAGQCVCMPPQRCRGRFEA